MCVYIYIYEGYASAAGPPAVSAWQSEGLEALRLGWPS